MVHSRMQEKKMSPLLQLLLLLALIILAAKLAGSLSARLGQPAVLGELLVGLLLGPTALNLLGWPAFTDGVARETISLLAELGVILLMLIAGLEVDLRDLRRAGKASLPAGALGVVLPLLGGWGLAYLFGYKSPDAFAIGTLLTATSVSISAQTMLELGVLRSPEGVSLLGAAVADDILVLLILSFETALRDGSSGLPGLLLVILRMVLFTGIGGFLCLWGLPRLMRYVERWPVSSSVPAVALIATFLIAWAADYLGGFAAITGAFLVGLGLRRSPLNSIIRENMHTLGYALFVPLFFVSVGLQANVRALDTRLLLFTLLLALSAIVGKAIGNWSGARLGGLPSTAAFRLSLGMIPRGEVSLIAVALAVREGWVGSEFMAVVVLVVLATAIATPVVLKLAFHSQEKKQLQPRPS